MSRKTIQILALSLFVGYPAVVLARAPQQVTAASVATLQANAQAAAAQVSAAQAASTQAAAQATATQNAWRDAIANYSKAPAGPAKTAAQAAMQQAQAVAQEAQLAARNAAVQANAAVAASNRAAAQYAAAQAALARLNGAQHTSPAVTAAPISTPAAATASDTPPSKAAARPANSTAESSSASPTGAGKSPADISTFGEVNTMLGTIMGKGKPAGSGSGPGAAGTTDTGSTPTATGTPDNAAVSSNTRGSRGATRSPAASAPQPIAEATAPAQPARKVGAAVASGALGMGQASDSLLTVYGCTRMGTQIACDTDFSNQNNSVTQVSSADQWKDVYLQDDAGDNHMRSMAVFENTNGDQRTQVTLPYGEKSRYILLFNGVPANVKTVTLKSTANTLDVESIPITAPSAFAPASSGETKPAQ